MILAVFRQRQRQFIVSHQRNGWQQIITAAAGKQDSQAEQTADCSATRGGTAFCW
ncbi:hypothetical protein ACNKHS_22630 [Shigella flexneri]